MATFTDTSANESLSSELFGTRAADEMLGKEITGPVQAVSPTPVQTSWFTGRRSVRRLTKEQEKTSYLLNPLWRDVFEAKPPPDSIQEIEILDNTQLIDFFPYFENTAFKDLALKNCALVYYPREIEKNAPGLYFRTDLVLGGLLDGPLEFFRMFLSDSDIVIRLSAFLGFPLENNKPLHFDKIKLAGCLGGLRVSYPPGCILLEIISAGVRITLDNKKDKKDGKKRSSPESGNSSDLKKRKTETGSVSTPATKPETQPKPSATSNALNLLDLADPNKLASIGSAALTRPSGPVTTATDPQPDTTFNKGKSSFTADIFGNILLHLHMGSVVPLQLEYTAQYSHENVHLDMVLSEGKTWNHAFGIENFELKDIVVTADIPTKTANKAFGNMAEKAALDDGFACKIEGSWDMGTKLLSLKGEIYSSTKTQTNKSYIEAILMGPTFEDIRQAAKKLHGYEVAEPKQIIQMDSLRLRIDFTGKFAFYGMITVDGATFEAGIFISSGGIFISGKTQKFKIPDTDFYIKDASLDLFIARRSKDLPKDENGDPTAETNGNDEGTENNHEMNGTSEESMKSRDEANVKIVPKSAGKTSLDEAKRNDALSAVPGKEAASDTKSTDTPATTADAGSGSDKKPKKEVSWFFGFKVYGVLILPYGPKDLDGEYKFKFAVTFSVSYSPTKGAEVLLAGKARSTVSLRDICGDAIKKDSLLDAQLSDLTFMGTNSDNPDVPPEISRFPIKKGFYLCATLDRVPLLEDKNQTDGGKVLKKSAATDRAYLRIGYQKGDKIPKITIFLPPSFKVEFGSRFYSGAIFLELDAQSDPICRFYGELFMKMEEPGKKPIKFILEIAADHLGGSIGMKMDALDGIKGPLGFSDKFIVYSLQGSVGAKWAALLSTGALDSFGLGGRFTIDKDRYTCEMRLGTNPTQTLVNIKADAFGIPQLCNFISAVANEDVPVPDVDFVNMRDVDIYFSRGCTWLDTYYPSGVKLKGTINLWDIEASLDAEISSIGFHCLTKIKGFELGPLKLTGALKGEEYASMEITLNPIKQAFYLSGRIELFDMSCACFVDCQFMPSPKFVFDFELIWSDGLLVKVNAEMHKRKKVAGGKKDIATGKEVKAHPGGLDWEIYALMEQSIIAQVTQAIITAIENTHKAMEKGIKSAIDDVAREKEVWERGCREAQKKLDAEYKKQQDEIDRLDREIEAAQASLEGVKQRNERYTYDERAKSSAARAQAEKDRAARLEPKAAARRRADEDKETQERNQEWKMQEARNRRDNARDAFFSKFGDAAAAIDSALQDVHIAQREVDRLGGEVDRLVDRMKHDWKLIFLADELLEKRGALLLAKGGLRVYEETLRLAREIVDSPQYRELKEAMEAAERYLSTVGDQIRSDLETAGRIASQAFDELQKAIREEDLTFNNLVKHADDLISKVEKECQKSEEEARERSVVLDRQKQKMVCEFKQGVYVTLQEAAEFARKNNIALDAAEKTLAAFTLLEKAAYSAIRDFVAAKLDTMIDIQRIELKGIIRVDKSEQEAFHLSIKGKLGDKDFSVEESWMPNRTPIFLAKIGLHAVASITGSSMNKEIKALDGEMKTTSDRLLL